MVVRREEELLQMERERAQSAWRKKRKQWFEPMPQRFLAETMTVTTILFGGLTTSHDYLLEGALLGLGYRAQRLDCPDTESFQYGKEFGNRGQCNPAYFTVGNLIKYLCRLRDVEGKSKEEIINHYVFITSDSCGPCRFGAYITEYRKALRDAGFDDFRVLLFQQERGLKQVAGKDRALIGSATFVISICKAIFLGDILNALTHRIRPYEIEPGSTDRALAHCRQHLYEALRKRKWIIPALRQCRKALESVQVDRTRVKPKVSIIGEFWAMTTEGDGNYRLSRFLEDEGAETETQPLTAWILYLIWAARYDTVERMRLRAADFGRKGLKGKHPVWRLTMLRAARHWIRIHFQTYAKAIGLHGYRLPNMNEIAKAADAFYDNHLRGGEGHMEVGKLILTVVKRKANMTISVKPFGCMPSSGVSDGVQSLVTDIYPEAIFLPIETTGDGAINVYSRIQMMLFKARQAAQTECVQALAETGVAAEQLSELRGHASFKRPLKFPRDVVACTAANAIYGMHNARRRFPV